MVRWFSYWSLVTSERPLVQRNGADESPLRSNTLPVLCLRFRSEGVRFRTETEIHWYQCGKLEEHGVGRGNILPLLLSRMDYIDTPNLHNYIPFRTVSSTE